jgi:hypothetical protein
MPTNCCVGKFICKNIIEAYVIPPSIIECRSFLSFIGLDDEEFDKFES